MSFILDKAEYMSKQLELSDPDFGDCKIIASIYNDRHEKHGLTVSSSYVSKILKGDRPASPGTAAQEILEIATKYITTKNKCKRELIAA